VFDDFIRVVLFFLFAGGDTPQSRATKFATRSKNPFCVILAQNEKMFPARSGR
jgi:hypothetical protein